MVEGILNYYRSDPISFKEAETIMLPQFFSSLFEMIEKPSTATIKLPSQEEIYCNKSALNQIFMNLINNSFRYNNKPNPLLVITLKEDDERYSFSVTDNGIGIPANKIDKIFDLFTTVNKKDVKGRDSTGIGLSIVKKLVTNLGGKIKVESTPDIRTTFRFTIKKH
jgi:signal transduction histidine kinase